MTSQRGSHKALLGRKLGMTQVWDENGFFVPVTLVDVSTNVVTAVKSEETDGYKAIQIGYGQIDPTKVTKPLAGHFAKAGVTPRRHLVEVRTEDAAEYEPGQELSIDAFAEGSEVDVTGTTKGKGFALAEQNKEAWHWTVPFNRNTGLPTVSVPPVTYTSVAREYIMRRAETDDKFVLVTPNMPGSFGFTPDLRAKLGSKFVDVGIAEEQAVAMASGLAKGGANPLIITNTTFMQRAYDQLSQDLCINGNAVTILLNYANFDGLTDVTHLGIFGISAFSNIPNLTVLAPSNRAELVSMLDWSLDKANRPVIILMPGNAVNDGATQQPYDPTKYNVTQHGEKVAVIALGDFYAKGQSLAEYIEKSLGFTPTLADARNASTIGAATLDEIAKNCKVVVTLEDGILDGGLGQKIAAHYATTDVKVLTYGLNKVFYDRYDPNELLKSLGITNEQMAAKIAELL